MCKKNLFMQFRLVSPNLSAETGRNGSEYVLPILLNENGIDEKWIVVFCNIFCFKLVCSWFFKPHCICLSQWWEGCFIQNIGCWFTSSTALLNEKYKLDSIEVLLYTCVILLTLSSFMIHWSEQNLPLFLHVFLLFHLFHRDRLFFDLFLLYLLYHPVRRVLLGHLRRLGSNPWSWIQCRRSFSGGALVGDRVRFPDNAITEWM